MLNMFEEKSDSSVCDSEMLKAEIYPDVSAGVVVVGVHEVKDEHLCRIAEVCALQRGQVQEHVNGHLEKFRIKSSC